MSEGASSTPSRGAGYGSWLTSPATAQPIATSHNQATLTRRPTATGAADKGHESEHESDENPRARSHRDDESGVDVPRWVGVARVQPGQTDDCRGAGDGGRLAVIRAPTRSLRFARRTASRPTSAPPTTATA